MAKSELLDAGDIGQCFHRVALSRDAEFDVIETPISPELQRRFRDGRQWRESVLDSIEAQHPAAWRAASHADTRHALALGAPLILSPRLDDDHVGRRRASCDVLVRVSEDPATYVPVVIKNSELVGNFSTRQLLQGSIDQLDPAQATWTSGRGLRRGDTVKRHGLQLAHATRVLQAQGYGAVTPYGGVFDRQGRLWWVDLANNENPKFNLDYYDTRYEIRRGILEGLDTWRRGESSYPTTPYWHKECDTCPLSENCEPVLAARDDVSLVRFTNFSQQEVLRANGISTRVELSRLNPERARRAAKSLPVGSEASVEDHVGRRIDKLDELIYRARAHVAQSPLRIVDAHALSCPTADVEIDVDMESYNDCTYLWGAYVSLRRPVEGLHEGYFSFVSWEPLSADVESRVFSDFWTWFSSARDLTHAAGASFAAYCFWAQAENSSMNRAIATATDSSPDLATLDAFRHASPPEWIDMHEVVKTQIQTEGPVGLKVVAKAAGFTWRDENPSGEASMLWYEEASDAANPTRDASRERILTYNEDDCRATRALRAWMNDGAALLPSREDRPPA